MVYESRKHNGELPIIGVNTFLKKKDHKPSFPMKSYAAPAEEKEWQIGNLIRFKERNK